MATRYKWFRFESRIRSTELFEMLTSPNFSREADTGFIATGATAHELSGRYFWKSEVEATNFDNFGNEVVERFSTVSFLEFAFCIEGDQSYIRVKNPGRSVTAFANSIEAIAGLGFWVESVNLLELIGGAISHSVEQLKLVGLKATNVAISEKVVARVEFASKENIEEIVLKDYLRHPHVLEYCAFEILHHGVRGQASFSRTGQVKVSDQLAPLVIGIVEQTLFGEGRIRS